MKKTKTIYFVLALLLVLSTFIGCNNEGKEETTDTTKDDPEVNKMETIRVWTNDAPYQEITSQLVDEYNKGKGIDDGIFIEYTVFGEDYNDVLKIALAADQGPEIYKFVGTVKEPFINSGWMLPIDDLPGSEEFLSKYDGILIDGYNTFDGKNYSVPFKVLTTKFLYNKTLLEKSGITTAPVTWDDVIEYAEKVTVDNNGDAYGYGVHLKDAGSSGKWYFATQFGRSIGHMGYDFQEGRYAFTDFTENIKKILQMKEDGSIFPGGEGMGNDDLRAQFAAGRIAMLPGVCWDVSGLDQLGFDFELGICDTPVIDVDNQYKNYAQVADVLCVGVSAEVALEKAMIVYEFMHSDEFQLLLQEGEVDFMAREDIQQMSSGNYSKIGTAEFGDTSNSYFTKTPPDGGIAIEGQPYQNTIVNLIGGPIDVDVAAVLQDLEDRYNAALDAAIEEGLDMTLYIDENWDTSVD